MRWITGAGSKRAYSILAEHREPLAVVRAKLSRVIAYLKQNQRNRVDYATFKEALLLCCDARALADGRFVHAQILAHNLAHERSLTSSIIFMYGKCGDVDAALRVFASIKELNQACWNGLMTAFMLNGRSAQAIHAFRSMQLDGTKPNRCSFTTVFNACTRIAALAAAKQIFATIACLGSHCGADLHNAILNTFCKCGTLADVESLFAQIEERNVASWTLAVSAYAQHGHMELAILSLRQMQLDGIQPNRVTFLAVLDACIERGQLDPARRIHRSLIEAGIDADVTVSTSLVDMYTKCGSLEDARAVFSRTSHRADVVAWTAMISSLVRFEQPRDALRHFRLMQLDGVSPNFITCLICLNACAAVADLREGRFVHDKIASSGFDEDLNVGNALVDMYGSCGSLAFAKSVFDAMPERDKASWNSLLVSRSQFGESVDALDLFFAMQLDGVFPDGITFVGVLFACASAGMLGDGHRFYASMAVDFGIAVRFQHCGCVLDLLGRVGWLDLAEEYVRVMPFYPDDKKWMSLLGCCKIHGDVQLAERAAHESLEMTAEDSAPYLLLASVYAGEEEQLDELVGAGERSALADRPPLLEDVAAVAFGKSLRSKVLF